MEKELRTLVDVEVEFMTELKNRALEKLEVTDSEAWLFSTWVWQSRDWLQAYLNQFSKMKTKAGKDLRGEL